MIASQASRYTGAVRHLPVRIAFVLCAIVLLLSGCVSSRTAEQPIVILVSIDGFRGDYLDTFRPPALLALAESGVRADGLIPQFPSKTFPNHYTLVTGLRPANHGVISNNMVTGGIPGRFAMSNRDVLADPRWWGGEPVWNTAERQGRLASAMFWPGSEAAIGGHRATYWIPYDHAMPNDTRIAKTLEWLAQAEGRRPSFLTVYFSDVDSAGHSMGPDSTAVRDAIARVDASIARLVDGVRAARLDHRVHYVVVSDHGMAALSPERMIVLDDLIDHSKADVVDWSPVLMLSPKDGDGEALYRGLRDKHEALTVYKSSELPAKYRLAGHPRLPAIIGVADEGWFITSQHDVKRWAAGDGHAPGGAHGYDPALRSMHGLFIAAGPQLQRGMRVPAFENIHVYELLCALLGVQPAENDGHPAVTRPMLL